MWTLPMPVKGLVMGELAEQFGFLALLDRGAIHGHRHIRCCDIERDELRRDPRWAEAHISIGDHADLPLAYLGSWVRH